jgi:hypothetical protein
MTTMMKPTVLLALFSFISLTAADFTLPWTVSQFGDEVANVGDTVCTADLGRLLDDV